MATNPDPEEEFAPFTDVPVSRAILPGPGYREQGRTLFGNLAPYDEWAEIKSPIEGHFLERYSRGAIRRSLAESDRSKLRVLFQHGQDPTVGIKPLGTIERLEEGQRAPEYEVALFDADYVNELKPALEAGQFGTSWTFRPVKNKFTVVSKPQRSVYNPQGLPEITHHEIQMTEFGPCVFQVFAGATAGIRSATDYFLVERIKSDPEGLRQFGLTLIPEQSIISAEALSNERAEVEPHSGAESSNVPLVPVRKRFHSSASWLAWCESALK